MKKLVILFTLFAIKLCAMEQPTTTSIHDAVKQGNLAEVQRWLDRGVDINKPDINGNTPLHWATFNGHQNIVEYLIDHGANVNQPDNRECTPLLTAALMGHQNILEYLITHGAVSVINQQSNFDDIPLHCPALNGHQNTVEYLIAYGANPLIQDEDLCNAIDLAEDSQIKKLIVQKREQYFESHLPLVLQFLRNRRHGMYTASHESKIVTLFREWQEWEQYKKDHPDIVALP